MKAKAKWQIDVIGQARRFIVYGGTRAAARARARRVVGEGPVLRVVPWTASANPVAMVDGRAAPGA